MAITNLPVDGRRRITLPVESGVQAGDLVAFDTDNHTWEPLVMIPKSKFDALLAKIGDEHAETFRRLAKR